MYEVQEGWMPQPTDELFALYQEVRRFALTVTDRSPRRPATQLLSKLRQEFARRGFDVVVDREADEVRLVPR